MTTVAAESSMPENARTGMGSRRALFIDRDGTLIVDKVYLSDPSGVELIPGVAEAIRRVSTMGYSLFLFTNQSGIGRGYYTIREAEAVNRRMEELIGLASPIFTGICIAPEAPGQPVSYRKPSPRFIEESIVEHGLDAGLCWMVGDSESDMRAGMAAGIRTALVRTGKVAPSTLREVQDGLVPVYDTFAEFAATLV